MAGAYVRPLVDALKALNDELQSGFEAGQENARYLLDTTATSDKQIRAMAERGAAIFGMEREA